jgi:CHAT domain-containing protein
LQELRSFILGDVNKKERQIIEERLMTETAYFEELAMLEEELVQDYVNQKLSAAESKKFEQHFLVTKENRQKVKFAKAMNKIADEQPTEKKQNFFSSLIAFFMSPIPAFGAILIIGGIIGFFAWKNYNNQSEIAILLNKAQKNERPLDSRISDFDYAPNVKSEGTRSGNAQSENKDLELAEAKAKVLAAENPTAENLHELGRVYLAEKKFDEAIIEFEKAIKKNPNIAKLHNDLGVAYLEKGSQNKRENEEKEKQNRKVEEEKPYLELLAKANEEFAKAIELDKNLLEAYFNQALCIQLLNLPNQAKEAWENYLKLDSTSKWADEARKNLQNLEENKPISKTKEEILQDFLQAKEANDDEKAWQIISSNRDLGSSKLIPQQLAFLFVNSKVAGNEIKAKEALDALVYAGKLEEEKCGDLFWKELAYYYKNISNNKITKLNDAQNSLIKAHKLRKDRKLNESTKEFKLAKDIFMKVENFPLSHICDYWIANQLFHLNNIKESNSIYLNMANYGLQNKYKWLSTQAYIRLVSGVGVENKLSKSIYYVEQAIKLAEQTSDIYDLQRGYSIIIDRYRQASRYDKAFMSAEKTMAINLVPEASQRQKWSDYVNIANLLFAKRFYKTSSIYQEEALQISKNINETYFEQVSLFHLGMIYLTNKQYNVAEQYFSNSLKIAETFVDEEVRRKNVALAKLKYAHFKRVNKKYYEAIQFYKEVNEFHDTSQFKLESYDGQKGLLLSYLQNKDVVYIQDQIEKVLEIFKEYRSEIIEEQNRNSFFNNEQDVYDIATEYEFEKANFIKAFDYAEESRSRSLLDLQNSVVQVSTEEKIPEIRFSENLSEPLKLDQIQTEMPENIQFLVYSVLPEKVLIWSITKDNLATAKSEISSDNLQEKVTNYLELVSKNQELSEQIKLTKELYQTLITPIKDKLDSQKQIVIIPDKFLFRLPFATLYSDKYFIEDYKISYSPSANVFLNCTKKGKEFNSESAETLLSIGNPTFNETDYKNLQSLPSAKQEATEIAKSYEKSKILVENNATKNQVKSNLKNADIVHFAGHYLVEEKTPLLSSLVLAGDREESLANYEIISEKLSNTRLIVLSACDTGIEKYYKGEGMIGASRTFLAINVPIVVASQWKVDSESTKELMIRFHQLRKTEKFSTTEALRKSQIEMMKNEKFNQPYYWAAFLTLGGYTQF